MYAQVPISTEKSKPSLLPPVLNRTCELDWFRSAGSDSDVSLESPLESGSLESPLESGKKHPFSPYIGVESKHAEGSDKFKRKTSARRSTKQKMWDLTSALFRRDN